MEDETLKLVKSSEKSPAEPNKDSSSAEDSKPKRASSDTQQITDKLAGISSLPGYESKRSILPSWFKELFGQRNKLSNDWESRTLETYIIADNSHPLLKVPFEHKNLTQGLRQMKKQCLPWDQYVALGSQHHQRINQAVRDVKGRDPRERTCVAISLNQEFGWGRIMLFFLVGASVEPVHLKDAIGRDFSFPYEHCRTYPVSFEQISTCVKLIMLTLSQWMRTLIDQAFSMTEWKFANPVHRGRYHLLDEQGNIILPGIYHTMVRPGSKITQQLWPFPHHHGMLGPLPGANWPPHPPNPPNNSGSPPLSPKTRGPAPHPIPPRPVGSNPPRSLKSDSTILPRPSRTNSRSTDSSILISHSDIEDEPEDLGIEIDFDKEDENAELSFGELLGKFTNATDTVHDILSSDDDSSSGYGSS